MVHHDGRLIRRTAKRYGTPLPPSRGAFPYTFGGKRRLSDATAGVILICRCETLIWAAMIFGRTASYALRALLFLTREGSNDRYFRADEIAKSTGTPANYTGKILNTLVRARLVKSSRGPAGGFRLAANPADVTAADIVDLFNGPRVNRQCILGLKSCNQRRPCDAHRRWSAVLDAQRAPLAATTIADLAFATPSKRNGHHA